MMDQITYLKSCGITASSVCNKGEVIDVENLPSLLYSSPESLLCSDKWRSLMSSTSFIEQCVGIVTDEAHCIANW